MESYQCRIGGIIMRIEHVALYVNDLEKTKKLIDLCDGLLFPGGEDIDPGYYGENPHKNLGEIRPEVDKFLFHSLLYALEQRKPALGICKGMQMMVVATGGSLYQDI